MNTKYEINVDVDNKVIIKSDTPIQITLENIIKRRDALKIVQDKLKKKFIGIDSVIQNIIQQIYE